jgi:hypothetical protein
MHRTAGIALQTVARLAPTLQSVRCIRFVLYDRQALAIHAKVLESIASERR